MPTEVVFANTISVVGRKVLSCSKDKASAPTASASSFALSEFTEQNKTQKENHAQDQCLMQKISKHYVFTESPKPQK